MSRIPGTILPDDWPILGEFCLNGSIFSSAKMQNRESSSKDDFKVVQIEMLAQVCMKKSTEHAAVLAHSQFQATAGNI
jgi:hypothetical protein